MKKLVLVAAAVLAVISTHTQAAQVTLQLTIGQLLTSGSVAIPNGSLIQLIADTSNSFSSPSASSFTGNDPNEIVLASFVENSATIGVAGDDNLTVGPFTLSGNGTLPDSGDFLLLRWYPTLTSSSTAPGAGTSYGQFRTDSVADGSDIAWVMPASGSKSLNFITASQGGSQANSAGVASFTVAAVPEPAASPLLIGALAVGALIYRKHQKRQQA